MITPTIHMNGTSRRALLADLTGAIKAVNAAVDAVKKTCPHGRDYYPQGPNAIKEALRQHCARVSLLEKVIEELTTLAISVT
jgi:hypothetical protein